MTTLGKYLDHKLVQFNEYNNRATGKFNEIAYDNFYKNLRMINMRGGAVGDLDTEYTEIIANLGTNQGLKTEVTTSVERIQHEINATEEWFLSEWETKIKELIELLNQISSPDAKNILTNNTVKSYITLLNNAADQIKSNKQVLEFDTNKAVKYNKHIPGHTNLIEGGSNIVKYNSYNNKANNLLNLIIELKNSNKSTKTKINKMLGGAELDNKVQEETKRLDDAIANAYNSKRKSLVDELTRIRGYIEEERPSDHVAENEKIIAGLDQLVNSLIEKIDKVAVVDNFMNNKEYKVLNTRVKNLKAKGTSVVNGFNELPGSDAAEETTQKTGLSRLGLEGGKRRKSSKKSSKKTKKSSKKGSSRK